MRVYDEMGGPHQCEVSGLSAGQLGHLPPQGGVQARKEAVRGGGCDDEPPVVRSPYQQDQAPKRQPPQLGPPYIGQENDHRSGRQVAND